MAALLTEPTNIKAAQKAGISERTLYRWLDLPEFQAAYRQSSNSLMQSAFFRALAFSGPMVDSLVNTACHGRRDSDRTRCRRPAKLVRSLPGQTRRFVRQYASSRCHVSGHRRRSQIFGGPSPPGARFRLTSGFEISPHGSAFGCTAAAMHEDETVKRQEAIQNVLQNRKEEKP